MILDAFMSEFGLVDIGATRRLFKTTREDGIPNFFSSIQSLSVGVVLFIALVARDNNRSSGSKPALVWGIVTALFIYSGIDDATKLHGRIGSIFSALFTDSGSEAYDHLLGRIWEAFPPYTR